MEDCNITTRLNIKIISVVFLLMLTITAYNHFLSLQEEKKDNTQALISITNFLVKKTPANAFSEAVPSPDAGDSSNQKQILALNEKLQPILNEVFTPINTIKFGFYSQKYDSIVAIGPQADKALLIDVYPTPMNELNKAAVNQPFIERNSIVWHGASALTYSSPIEENGAVVGYVFATINQDAISAALWRRTVNNFLGAFLMLLICIIIFREIFIKLKKDLQLFAESIRTGRSYNYHSKIAEFTPILNYISEQTEHMTRLDRLNIIGEMAAGFAHEIRNPMTTVRGLLQFIGNKQEFTKQKENFSLMIHELDRANSIITEFLSLAKNRAMDFKKTNLNTIIQNIYPLLKTDALCNMCEINLKLNTIPNIYLDQSSINQLLFNMIRNALDAMSQGGIINIRTEYIDSKVVLSIEDSGTGIASDIKDKIGTPFFTTKETGTGLGLAICYRIVQRHAAILTCNSEVGKGTTFIIKFDPKLSEINSPDSTK